MAAMYILAVLAVAFLAAAMMRLSRGGSIRHPQTRTWLLVSVIFASVSAWLFWQGNNMGHGTAPAGIDLDALPPIDDGTSARTGSPTPGPVGLDSTSGDAKAGNMADQIVSYARRQQGERVGKGQCFDLADTALRGAKAKSAADYGKISPNADYTWGTPVTLAGLQPGDVIQFRNYAYESTVVTKTDKATTTDEVAQDRPHHTAIVESVGENGAVTVLEQNAPDGSPVTRTVLYFKDSTTTSGKRTTTIKVKGKFWFFRPEAS
jgi:hypothetical protein